MAPTPIPAYYIQEDEERGHTRDKEQLTTEDSVRKMTPQFCSCQTRLIANYSPWFTSTLACSSSSGSWITISEETVERPQVGPGLSLSLPSKTETRNGNQVTERRKGLSCVSGSWPRLAHSELQESWAPQFLSALLSLGTEQTIPVGSVRSTRGALNTPYPRAYIPCCHTQTVGSVADHSAM